MKSNFVLWAVIIAVVGSIQSVTLFVVFLMGRSVYEPNRWIAAGELFAALVMLAVSVIAFYSFVKYKFPVKGVEKGIKDEKVIN